MSTIEKAATETNEGRMPGETPEEYRRRLDGEISELTGQVEQLEYEHSVLFNQAQIVARNSREIAGRGMSGSFQVSNAMDKAAAMNRRLGQARLQLKKKRDEYVAAGGRFTRGGEIQPEDYTWGEWAWSWLGYKPERSV